jgi:hypothetical protein
MNITVITDDIDMVEEYCSFFYDPVSRRIVIVPDSMYYNVMDRDNGHVNSQKWIKLNN